MVPDDSQTGAFGTLKCCIAICYLKPGFDNSMLRQDFYVWSIKTGVYCYPNTLIARDKQKQYRKAKEYIEMIFQAIKHVGNLSDEENLAFLH